MPQAQDSGFLISPKSDLYRTRLTHSLEVPQTARSVCRGLGLSEDLAKALALWPMILGIRHWAMFGKEALRICMAHYGGFDHNAQALRIVARLEHRYAAFNGLNLTWETLESIVKHNDLLLLAAQSSRVEYSTNYGSLCNLEPDTWPSLEAQVVTRADDIVYNNHDLDDGRRADLFTIDELTVVPLVEEVFASVRDRYPGLE